MWMSTFWGNGERIQLVSDSVPLSTSGYKQCWLTATVLLLTLIAQSQWPRVTSVCRGRIQTEVKEEEKKAHTAKPVCLWWKLWLRGCQSTKKKKSLWNTERRRKRCLIACFCLQIKMAPTDTPSTQEVVPGACAIWQCYRLAFQLLRPGRRLQALLHVTHSTDTAVNTRLCSLIASKLFTFICRKHPTKHFCPRKFHSAVLQMPDFCFLKLNPPHLCLCHMLQSPDQKWVGQRRAHAQARWCALAWYRL